MKIKKGFDYYLMYFITVVIGIGIFENLITIIFNINKVNSKNLSLLLINAFAFVGCLFILVRIENKYKLK